SCAPAPRHRSCTASPGSPGPPRPATGSTWSAPTTAEFEYTCGEGDDKRHGVWRGVVHEGKVYSFYLTASDAKFAESKPIFDEMVKSFQLTGSS
ncbi:serine/threonine protein kinase, partial [Micromonospora wenchangensis]